LKRGLGSDGAREFPADDESLDTCCRFLSGSSRIGWIIRIEMPSFNAHGGPFPMGFTSKIPHRTNSRQRLQQLGIGRAAVRLHDLNRISK
jgi:hypothetical protein